MVLAQDRNIDQWNKIESPEINPHTYGNLIYDKGGRVHNGEKTVSSKSSTGKSGQLCVKKIKLEHCLIPCTKINSKWIKDLNVKPDTIKLLEKNLDRTL